jgi:protein TonB
VRRIGYAVISSVVAHVLLMATAQQLPAHAAPRRDKIVPLAMIDAPLPPVVEPPPPAPVPIAPPPRKRASIKPRPKPIEAPREIESPAPEPVRPAGLSLDSEHVVHEGNGPAAPAIENGGNMFADPNDGEPPAQKTPVHPSPPPPAPAREVPDTAAVRLTSDREAAPPYPMAAQRAEIEGQVTLNVYVGPDGRVDKVKVMRGLGYGCDEISMRWVKEHWRFKPATHQGRAIGAWISVPVSFVLDR